MSSAMEWAGAGAGAGEREAMGMNYTSGAVGPPSRK